MAKKKSHKKQTFKYAQPTARVETMPAEVVAIPTSAASYSANAVVLTTVNDNPYLGKDLKQLGIIAAGLIALEFGLWFLFTHSSIGPAVYNLYKIAS